MKIFLFLFLFFMAVPATSGAASPVVIRGPVSRVIDGDTIVVDGKVIRLFGIDAPEMDTVTGGESATALRRIIAARPVSCVRIHEDRYRRIVAICRSGKRDIGARMIESGHAVPYKIFSQGFYGGK